MDFDRHTPLPFTPYPLPFTLCLEKVLYLGKPQDRTFRYPLPSPISPTPYPLTFPEWQNSRAHPTFVMNVDRHPLNGMENARFVILTAH